MIWKQKPFNVILLFCFAVFVQVLTDNLNNSRATHSYLGLNENFWESVLPVISRLMEYRNE